MSGDSGSVVVNVATTTPFTLTATNAGGTATKGATVTVAASVDRFVDVAAGSDQNDCSSAGPCKTIGKAMTGAVPGTTVYLADGIYAPTTQGNGVTVADEVRDPARDDACLARSRAGENQQRTFRVQDRFHLFRIQGIEEVHLVAGG